ncbi:MAG TPA: hypothetical protein VKA46_28810 [Gemmataceae bacterium]|nr:hypothetical protein [Gemmataceae bacterium]
MSESLGRVGEVPPALGRRINEACNRFEAAWRSDTVPRLEDFVAGWEGAERPALLRELVPLDADYRRQRSEPCRPADYLARFPDLDPSCLGDSLAAGPGPSTPTVSPDEALPQAGLPSHQLLVPGDRQSSQRQREALRRVAVGVFGDAPGQRPRRVVLEGQLPLVAVAPRPSALPPCQAGQRQPRRVHGWSSPVADALRPAWHRSRQDYAQPGICFRAEAPSGALFPKSLPIRMLRHHAPGRGVFSLPAGAGAGIDG